MKPRRIHQIFVNFILLMILGSIWMAWQYQQNQKAQGRYGNDSTFESKLRKVDRVIDGDTIRLKNGDSVRLCGIDAPETPKKNKQGQVIKPGQPLGEEATAKLQQWIDEAGGEVIVFALDRRDHRDRIIGEIFVPDKSTPNPSDEKVLNYELVVNGYAFHYPQYSKDCPNGMHLESAEEKARAANLGVWKAGVLAPWEFRKQQRGN